MMTEGRDTVAWQGSVQVKFGPLARALLSALIRRYDERNPWDSEKTGVSKWQKRSPKVAFRWAASGFILQALFGVDLIHAFAVRLDKPGSVDYSRFHFSANRTQRAMCTVVR
jgi:hypothetical protein